MMKLMTCFETARPATIPIPIAASALTMRLRSSTRWSKNDIAPPGSSLAGGRNTRSSGLAPGEDVADPGVAEADAGGDVGPITSSLARNRGPIARQAPLYQARPPQARQARPIQLRVAQAQPARANSRRRPGARTRRETDRAWDRRAAATSASDRVARNFQTRACSAVWAPA